MKAPVLGLVLMAIAIAMRVLIPQGFMPTEGASAGHVVLALCADQGVGGSPGLLAAHHDAGGDATDPKPGHPSPGVPENPQCAFAGWQAAPAPEPTAPATTTVWRAVEPAGSAEPAGPITIAAAKPPATGPPARA